MKQENELHATRVLDALTSYGGSKAAAHSHSTGGRQHLDVPRLVLKHTDVLTLQSKRAERASIMT